MLTNTTVALKPNFMSSLLLCAVFLYTCIFFNPSKKSSQERAQANCFPYFWSKILYSSLYDMLKLPKTTRKNTVSYNIQPNTKQPNLI